MKISRKTLLLTILLSIFFSNILIIGNHTAQSAHLSTSSAISSTANSSEIDFPIYSEGAILMESSTGKVLLGKNENKKLYPASTTKILTAILAIENCGMNDKLTASKNAIMAIPSGYSNAAIQQGETLTVQELLELFLIHSANEVGYIFAEHISGNIDDFALLMNKKASEIGCNNTHFTNPSGLHDVEHYSTAYDMALIAKYCMKNETFRNIVSKTSCTVAATDKYDKRYFKNTNNLIDPSSKYYYKYAIGIKTGFTSQAKNCLISASKKNDLELITVVLGSEATEDGRSGRYVDSLNLFEYGFANFNNQQIATANAIIDEITINNATKDTKNLPLLLKETITAFVPINLDLSNLDYSIELKENITAPISENEILGKITYNINDITYSSDLIAAHSVEKFNVGLLIAQIFLSVFVLFILYKFLRFKKKNFKI